MIKRTITILLSAVFVLSLCACSSENTQSSDKLQIVATNFPAYDFCMQVAGGTAEVKMLLSPGEEAHSYDPTPQDIIAINNCDIFVYGGGESDAWADSILSTSSCKNEKRVAMMDCVEAINEELKAGMQTPENEDDEYDEHVWTSPVNAAKIVESIVTALCEIDSENETLYRANAESYIEQLELLDGDIRTLTSNAERNTLIFADRFPILYFAREYSLEYWAAYPGCSGETEAKPSTIAFLIDKVKEEKIPAVFKLELSNGSMAQSVATEAGVEILTFYSCQTVSKADFDAGEGYISLMRKNIDALTKALY